jgi:hypothetical protein
MVVQISIVFNSTFARRYACSFVSANITQRTTYVDAALDFHSFVVREICEDPILQNEIFLVKNDDT